MITRATLGHPPNPAPPAQRDRHEIRHPARGTQAEPLNPSQATHRSRPSQNYSRAERSDSPTQKLADGAPPAPHRGPRGGSGGPSPRTGTASPRRSRVKSGEHRATPGGYGGKPPGVAIIGVPTGARNAGSDAPTGDQSIDMNGTRKHPPVCQDPITTGSRDEPEQAQSRLRLSYRPGPARPGGDCFPRLHLRTRRGHRGWAGSGGTP